MTDLMANNKDESVTDNVAVTDEVAVADIATTGSPNQPRAKLTPNTNGKTSQNTHIPGRANHNRHWRSQINREVTKQNCMDYAKANTHSPGKGPSHNKGISLSQMTPSQTMAHAIEISKVDTGKVRASTPDTSDSDLEPTPPIPKTVPKTAKKTGQQIH